MLLRDMPRVETLQALARRYDIDVPAMLGYLSVLFVAREIEQVVEARLAKDGLSQGRFAVLSLLYHAPDHALTPAELADRATVTRGTMTGLLDGLESDGLVKRAVRKDDRRMTDVRLTAAGVKLVERVLPDHLRAIAAMMKALTRDERKTLVELLEKLRAGIPALRG